MRWYTADFDALSWRDVRVHGFRIVEGAQGTAELVLDIDFILEWLPEDDGYRFRIAQAILQFHEVFGLRFMLDYVACSAGMTAFSIESIEREVIGDDERAQSYRWRIDVNWPEGFLEFEAPGFSQWLVGEIVEQDGQTLDPRQRL
ncbi:MAG: hypothetical protein V4673_12265 [Pseudomonadota bacterium]